MGITYIEFLAQSESKPFKVGRTELISYTAGQLEGAITITHRDASGRRKDFTVGITADPYQDQSTRVVDDTEYVWDGFTRVLFRTILGNATVLMRIYPVEEFNAMEFIKKLKENGNSKR